MADSNSKKPMALLLLVVVAVLVVIMVSGKDAEFAGHDKLTTEADCTAAKGTWAKVMEPVANAADEKACTEAEGTWGGASDNGTPNDPSDDTKDSCTKEAEAETCAAPDYAGITAEADCTAAKGTWEAGSDNGTPDDDSDDTKDVCKPWEATASN